MKNIPRNILIVLIGIVTAVLPLSAQTPADRDANPELVAREKLLRAQFAKLTTRMLELATQVEQAEPQTAQILRQAVEESRRAFVAEDMEKVAELLAKGLAGAAANTKEGVIKELQDIWRIVQYGVMDSDERLKRIKDWEKILAELRDVIAKQQALEKDSRIGDKGEQMSKQAAEIAAKLQAIVGKQKSLLEQTQKTPAGEQSTETLAKLKHQIDTLLGDQQDLSKAAAQAPVDSLPIAAAAQKKLAQQAKQTADALAKAAADPKMSEALAKTGADAKALASAAQSTSQSSSEMTKASDALNASNASRAQPHQQQAQHDLKEAKKALEDALAKAAANTPGGTLAKDQRDLAKQTSDLAKAAQDLAKQTGLETPTDNLDRAGDEMTQAGEKLNDQDPRAAEDHQRKALAELQDQMTKAAELARRIKEKAAKPDTEQAAEQGDLADKTEQLARQSQQSESAQQSTPGKQSMASASKSMKKAQGQLSKSQSGQANQSQNDALEQLKKARQELSEAIQREQEVAQAEQIVKVETLLRKMLDGQKKISAHTRDIAGEGAVELTRQQQLKIAELARAEGTLAGQAATVLDMLKKEGSTVIFPTVLQEVQADLKNVQTRLTARQTGELTQGIQAEVERMLASMIAALQKEQARRRKQPPGGGGGGAGGGGGGGKQPLVPPVAELKMLKMLQEQINSRTLLLARSRGDQPQPTEDSRQQHQAVAARQGKIGEMAKQMDEQMKKAQQPGGRR